MGDDGASILKSNSVHINKHIMLHYFQIGDVLMTNVAMSCDCTFWTRR